MLAVDNLSFSYRAGGEDLFGGLTHEFRVGAVTALTGPSGRGKSTLLYLLGLMLVPSHGRITLDGESLADRPDAARSSLRAHYFGFVFQDAALDPSRRILDSVVEPAIYAGRTVAEAKPYARGLLRELGLGDRVDHRPGEISGGQAQRVAVCRALVNDPVVVLADEPTGNLDRENAVAVLSALAHAAAGTRRTVIIATHDPFVLDGVDDVLSL